MLSFLLTRNSGVQGVVTYAIALGAENQRAWMQLGMCHFYSLYATRWAHSSSFMPKVKAKSSPSESLPQGAKSKAQLSKKSNLKANENASARIVKALPAIKWAPLYLSLNREEVDDRIFIREFFLRFGDFLDPTVAKCHIEELELIGGRGRKQNEDNDGAAWVTDMCIKALVSSVLGVLAKDHDTSISKVSAYS